MSGDIEMGGEKTVGSEMVDRLHRFTQQLEAAQSVSELPEILTVRKVKLNLSPQPFSAAEVKEIRNCMRVSQAIFAEFLGVSAATVRDWEQGVSEPSGPARRVMAEMAREPEAWTQRLRDLAQVTPS